jgi:hypothetical protein
MANFVGRFLCLCLTIFYTVGDARSLAAQSTVDAKNAGLPRRGPNMLNVGVFGMFSPAA